ncbi:flagellar biosynthetic protein FliO [Desulfovibrio sp. OttesenSCG-928-C06]|nr:flagellar biosynthetic protein FliO [Desulfovibrio sp. OttesenSCG-928-C06]
MSAAATTGQAAQTAVQQAAQQAPLSTDTAQTATELTGQLSQQLGTQAATFQEYSWGGYFMALGMLCLLLAALWFALRFLKNRGGLRVFGVGTGVRVENRVSLGPKKNLLVVSAHGKRLLLGVTDHHISKLAELPLDDDEDADAQTTSAPSSGFGGWKAALRGKSDARRKKTAACAEHEEREKTPANTKNSAGSRNSFSESLNEVLETVEEHDEQH